MLCCDVSQPNKDFRIDRSRPRRNLELRFITFLKRNSAKLGRHTLASARSKRRLCTVDSQNCSRGRLFTRGLCGTGSVRHIERDFWPRTPRYPPRLTYMPSVVQGSARGRRGERSPYRARDLKHTQSRALLQRAWAWTQCMSSGTTLGVLRGLGIEVRLERVQRSGPLEWSTRTNTSDSRPFVRRQQVANPLDTATRCTSGLSSGM